MTAFFNKRQSRGSIGDDWKEGQRSSVAECPEGVDMDDWMAQRSSELQEMSLRPLKEDLSDWLNRIVGLNIEVDTFLNELETGVNICKLAELIHTRAAESGEKMRLPESKPRYYAKAKPKSWYARDNAASFIEWCKELGVKKECLFESDDLVFQKSSKAVILCLLEVARLVWKYGVEPPDIIKLEKELEASVENGDASNDSVCYPSTDVNVVIEDRKTPDTNQASPTPDLVQSGMESVDLNASPRVPDIISSAHAAEESQSVKSDSSGLDRQSAKAKRRGSLQKEKNTKSDQLKRVETIIEKPADLDAEVTRISVRMKCQEQVERLREGKYRIFGKEIFIRVLKQKHLMVRVGGGWQVLEHYIIRRQNAYLQRQASAT